MQEEQFQSRGVTLNSLLEEQRALNMRMLLAIRLRDPEVQEALRRELEDNAEQISRLLSGGFRRQDLPQ